MQKEYYNKLKLEHKCVHCGIKISEDTHVLCIACRRKQRDYENKNAESISEKKRKYNEYNKDHIIAQHKDYYNRTKDQFSKRAKKLRINLKMDILAHYGNQCNCCGETNIKFLTVDHIYNDGYKHLQNGRRLAGDTLQRWLRKNNYPPGFQMLCYNCNCGKAYNRDNPGICPHKEEYYVKK